MNTITTRYGTFNVTDNGKYGVILSIGNVTIAKFPNISWWNWDLLENAIEQHSELIEQRIEERVNKRNVTITKENAQQVLEQLMQVLGNDEKGFYSSRLKQCINKLKAVA